MSFLTKASLDESYYTEKLENMEMDKIKDLLEENKIAPEFRELTVKLYIERVKPLVSSLWDEALVDNLQFDDLCCIDKIFLRQEANKRQKAGNGNFEWTDKQHPLVFNYKYVPEADNIDEDALIKEYLEEIERGVLEINVQVQDETC
ncbi:unnamed protein product [marine sediment metagenome]|uniref:Uncharacterized protein n=1 Tax=marine sediment metagenome TaxID=412755 RepID=X0WLK9_9ZZZZ